MIYNPRWLCKMRSLVGSTSCRHCLKAYHRVLPSLDCQARTFWPRPGGTAARFGATEGFEIVREFVEIETGKGADALDRRPQLAAALAEARRRRCAVGVAKLATFTSSPASWRTACRSW